MELKEAIAQLQESLTAGFANVTQSSADEHVQVMTRLDELAQQLQNAQIEPQQAAEQILALKDQVDANFNNLKGAIEGVLA